MCGDLFLASSAHSFFMCSPLALGCDDALRARQFNLNAFFIKHFFRYSVAAHSPGQTGAREQGEARPPSIGKRFVSETMMKRARKCKEILMMFWRNNAAHGNCDAHCSVLYAHHFSAALAASPERARERKTKHYTLDSRFCLISFFRRFFFCGATQKRRTDEDDESGMYVHKRPSDGKETIKNHKRLCIGAALKCNCR